MASVRALRARRREKRAGNVLLIVLLILMMATSTATFVMHSAGQEQRAAGSMRNAIRARYVAETAAMTTLVLAEETPVGLPMNWGTSIDWSDTARHTDNRWRYGLPIWGAQDALVGMDPERYLLQSNKFTPMCVDQAGLLGPGATQPGGHGMYALSPHFDGAAPRAASAPTRLMPRFSSVSEVWRVNHEGRPSFRYIITGIGELVDPGAPAPPAGERGAQDVVSVSRAYYDVR